MVQQDFVPLPSERGIDTMEALWHDAGFSGLILLLTAFVITTVTLDGKSMHSVCNLSHHYGTSPLFTISAWSSRVNVSLLVRVAAENPHYCVVLRVWLNQVAVSISVGQRGPLLGYQCGFLANVVLGLSFRITHSFSTDRRTNDFGTSPINKTGARPVNETCECFS